MWSIVYLIQGFAEPPADKRNAPHFLYTHSSMGLSRKLITQNIMTTKEHWDKALQEVTESIRGMNKGQSQEIKDKDILDSFINHYSKELNEDLYTPYSKARISGQDVEPIINSFLDSYASEIVEQIGGMGVNHPTIVIIKTLLRSLLDDRYIF